MWTNLAGFARGAISSWLGKSRGGATLTEVLMAVMLMGIGVVTLATLFPISILRSIQATQLTNATILRYNAETTVQGFPEFILDPDFNLLTAHVDEVYVFDPLGWHHVLPPDMDLSTAVTTMPDTFPRDWFGNDGVNAQANGTRRYKFFFDASETDAEFTVTLPDSWRFQVDAIPTAFTATSVTLPSSIDLTNLSIAEEDFDLSGTPIDLAEDRNINRIFDAAASRIQLFSATGRGGQSRNITAINLDTNTVYWTEDVLTPPLPAPPTPSTMGTGNGVLDVLDGEDLNDNGVLDGYELPTDFVPERVRILTQDVRYTWMMTVRNTGGVANVNVVVFFKRSFETEGEFIHSGPVGPPVRQAFLKDINVVRIDYSAAATPKPYLKKGSYVFDYTNGYWYRIQDFTDDGVGNVDLTIDRPALATSDTAILLKNIVEVYPIEAIAPTQ